MKILYITSDGFDTPSPNNQMAEVMINDFLADGFEVHLIQSKRKGEFPEIPDSLQRKDGFTCDVVERKVFDRNKFVKRYLDDARYAFSAMRRWLKVKDADVVYLQSNPTVIFPMVHSLAKARESMIITDPKGEIYEESANIEIPDLNNYTLILKRESLFF